MNSPTMQRSTTSLNTQEGFTLIELSIVLVIIGLLVGGILIGRDLINAASIRSQISQIDKYQTAVRAFRLKYNALPGDLGSDAAKALGFTPRGSNPGQGDNNGLIEGWNDGTSGLLVFGGESSMFWSDLSYANGGNIGLIDGSFVAPANPWSPASYNVTANTVGKYLPAAKIGNGNYIYVWSGGWGEWYPLFGPGSIQYTPIQKNYFSIGAVFANGYNEGFAWANMGLTVLQAFSIDSKIDDGLPQSGKVLAMYNAACAGWASGLISDNGCSYAGMFEPDTGGPVMYVGFDGTQQGWTDNWGPTCYDYNYATGAATLPMVYSTSTNANQVNCALSVEIQ